jgi:hypothetical protein
MQTSLVRPFYNRDLLINRKRPMDFRRMRCFHLISFRS